MKTSPGFMVPALRLMTIVMLSPMEPRCTGMCGALAISWPAASKIAQEKSSRSLMLTECAVLCSRTPICSATDMNRLLKISSMTGSAVVLVSGRAGRPPGRVSSRSPRPVTAACQPGSTTVVAKSSVMRAGPGTTRPGRSPLRGRRSTSAHSPPVNIRTRAGGDCELAVIGMSGAGGGTLPGGPVGGMEPAGPAES